MATLDPNAPAAPDLGTPMVLAVDSLRMTNCGDHAERVRQSHLVEPGETVEALVRRVFGLGARYARPLDLSDEVVIRVVQEAKPPASDQPETDPWSVF